MLYMQYTGVLHVMSPKPKKLNASKLIRHERVIWLISRTLQFHCNVRLLSWNVVCRQSVVCLSVCHL